MVEELPQSDGQVARLDPVVAVAADLMAAYHEPRLNVGTAATSVDRTDLVRSTRSRGFQPAGEMAWMGGLPMPHATDETTFRELVVQSHC